MKEDNRMMKETNRVIKESHKSIFISFVLCFFLGGILGMLLTQNIPYDQDKFDLALSNSSSRKVVVYVDPERYIFNPIEAEVKGVKKISVNNEGQINLSGLQPKVAFQSDYEETNVFIFTVSDGLEERKFKNTAGEIVSLIEIKKLYSIKVSKK